MGVCCEVGRCRNGWSFSHSSAQLCRAGFQCSSEKTRMGTVQVRLATLSPGRALVGPYYLAEAGGTKGHGGDE